MLLILFFFFKQKTAYEMRISDWSSDVCSSDLIGRGKRRARVGLVLDDLEVDAAIGMLEADITLAEARARFSGRDPVAVQMADPPFERPLGDRIGADSELVRSLASLEAGPAGRNGRPDRPGRSQPTAARETLVPNPSAQPQPPLTHTP